MRPPVVVRDADGRIKMRNDHEKQRVLAIATKLVVGMIEKGEIDGDDDEAIKVATRDAVEVAVVAYRAAEEFLCG